MRPTILVSLAAAILALASSATVQAQLIANPYGRLGEPMGRSRNPPVLEETATDADGPCCHICGRVCGCVLTPPCRPGQSPFAPYCRGRSSSRDSAAGNDYTREKYEAASRTSGSSGRGRAGRPAGRGRSEPDEEPEAPSAGGTTTVDFGTTPSQTSTAPPQPAVLPPLTPQNLPQFTPTSGGPNR